MSDFLTPESYPSPTPLPPMRAGETDARFMDCSPALIPIADQFSNILTVSIAVARADAAAMTAVDLQPYVTTGPSLDPTGMIATFWWTAPSANTGADYILTLTANPTAAGRLFVRDWTMSILPMLG